MTNENCVFYSIDKDNNIISVSSNWNLFATQNQGAELIAGNVLGTPLFGYITNEQTRYVYDVLLKIIRKNKQKIEFPFRCDSPELKRFMVMEMTCNGEGEVTFKSCIVAHEPRKFIALLDKTMIHSKELVTVCSWCKKAKVDENSWLEMEDFVQLKPLFLEEYVPAISHGMCKSCYDTLMDKRII